MVQDPTIVEDKEKVNIGKIFGLVIFMFSFTLGWFGPGPHAQYLEIVCIGKPYAKYVEVKFIIRRTTDWKVENPDTVKDLLSQYLL